MRSDYDWLEIEVLKVSEEISKCRKSAKRYIREWDDSYCIHDSEEWCRNITHVIRSLEHEKGLVRRHMGLLQALHGCREREAKKNAESARVEG